MPNRKILAAPPLPEAVRELHKAISGILDYRQHVTGCEITPTDFCSCGLREAITALDVKWKAWAAVAQQERARLNLEAQCPADHPVGVAAYRCVQCGASIAGVSDTSQQTFAAAQQERARLAELFRRELKPAEGNTITNSDELADYLALVAHPPHRRADDL